MAKQSFKDLSRINWVPGDIKDGDYPGHERLQLGTLQRIADAIESMAANYDDMKSSRDYYKDLSERRFRALETERKRSAALKGVINRLKRKSNQ